MDAPEEDEDEVARLSESLAKARLPEDASKIAKRELKRLKNLQPQHPEYTTTHTYLELLAALPWSQSSDDRFDLKTAKAMLDEDHKGLDKVKTRLLEFMAVQKMRGDMKGPILCLHGPPGIGKTSLGRSIARALGRKFYRLALGGVRDEAEIRGHRRTYIGSMCGSIIQAFQTVGTNNPVILLDEVDKMTNNSMFNPMATLLEVLDPEQNSQFKDHYLNTPFDLSRALFICTANDASLIDRPLLDRMEVVDLSGYTLEEHTGVHWGVCSGVAQTGYEFTCAAARTHRVQFHAVVAKGGPVDPRSAAGGICWRHGRSRHDLAAGPQFETRAGFGDLSVGQLRSVSRELGLAATHFTEVRVHAHRWTTCFFWNYDSSSNSSKILRTTNIIVTPHDKDEHTNADDTTATLF